MLKPTGLKKMSQVYESPKTRRTQYAVIHRHVLLIYLTQPNFYPILPNFGDTIYPK